jgi:hypothetical protein
MVTCLKTQRYGQSSLIQKLEIQNALKYDFLKADAIAHLQFHAWPHTMVTVKMHIH